MKLLRDRTYYKTGGSCHELHEPKSISELAQIMQKITADNRSYFFLGAGSNSLVLDEYFDGHVICFEALQTLELKENFVRVGAGVSNTAFAEFALQNSLAGAGWMYRLPGQIGATVRMNARCYQGEISQIVHNIISVSPSGSIKDYQNEGVFRGYKDTIFMNNNEAIAECTFELTPGDSNKIKMQMQEIETDRISKNQFLHPSCGCVFKNNYQIGIPSGMLLESAGVHRLNTPQVFCNPLHANFVFNQGSSSLEILEHTLKMRELVFDVFGVFLEYEMEILGDLPLKYRELVNERRLHKPHEARLAPLRERFLRRN